MVRYSIAKMAAQCDLIFSTVINGPHIFLQSPGPMGGSWTFEMRTLQAKIHQLVGEKEQEQSPDCHIWDRRPTNEAMEMCTQRDHLPQKWVTSSCGKLFDQNLKEQQIILEYAARTSRGATLDHDGDFGDNQEETDQVTLACRQHISSYSDRGLSPSSYSSSYHSYAYSGKDVWIKLKHFPCVCPGMKT